MLIVCPRNECNSIGRLISNKFKLYEMYLSCKYHSLFILLLNIRVIANLPKTKTSVLISMFLLF